MKSTWKSPPTQATAPELFVRQYRLSGECPWCGEALRLRQSRRTTEPFLGCDAYPECRFTEPLTSAISVAVQDRREMLDTITSLREEMDTLQNNLAREKTLRQAEVHLLEEELITLKWRLALEQRLRQAQKTAARNRQDLDKDLKALIALSHPDKWDNHPVATALTQALLKMRERLTGGGQ